MYSHTTAAGNIPDDFISRNRVAAFSQMNFQGGFPFYQDTVWSNLFLLWFRLKLFKCFGRFSSLSCFSGFDLFVIYVHQIEDNTLWCNTPIPNCSEHIIKRLYIDPVNHFIQPVPAGQFLPVLVHPIGFFNQQSLPSGNILFPVFMFKPASDFTAAFRRPDNVQPVITRLSGLGCNDGYNIPVFQLRIQRHHLIIDFGPYTVITDFRMNSVGKIQWN